MNKTIVMIAVAAFGLASCARTQKAVDETVKETAEATAVASENTVINTSEILGEAAGDVVNLTDDNVFRPSSKVDALTVLDFNATWCGPCKMLHPVFEAAAKTFAGKVRFVSVDIDNLPQTAAAFDVQAVPTVIVLRPDGKSERFVGTQDLLPAEKFEKIVRDNL